VLWFLSGGPDRGATQQGGAAATTSPSSGIAGYFSAYTNNQSGSTETVLRSPRVRPEIKNPLEKESEQTQETKKISLYQDKISIERGTATYTDPSAEYLVLTNDRKNKEKINISGWSITSSATGKNITIGEASYLPYTSKTNPQQPIFLSPGDKAYVTTGRSPIGTSFRTNLCTGYFEQFQDFKPSLKNECPRIVNEENFKIKISGPNALNDACIDFIERMRTCTINAKPLPLTMQYECSSFINSEINYQTCVTNHKNEEDFYKSEWRIFLNRDEELWKAKRETIRLLDADGKVIDSLSY